MKQLEREEDERLSWLEDGVDRTLETGNIDQRLGLGNVTTRNSWREIFTVSQDQFGRFQLGFEDRTDVPFAFFLPAFQVYFSRL